MTEKPKARVPMPIIIGAAVVLFFVYRCSTVQMPEQSRPLAEAPRKSNPSSTPPPADNGRHPNWPADRQPGMALPVTARQLAKAYRSNELKADGMYLGQILRVTGPVRHVERTLGDIIVHIGEVSVYVRESEAEKASRLDEDTIATVDGWGAGAMVLGSPHITNAIIVSAKATQRDEE